MARMQRAPSLPLRALSQDQLRLAAGPTGRTPSKVKVANDRSPPSPAPDGKKTKADLVVFMTDGDPTAMNTYWRWHCTTDSSRAKSRRCVARPRGRLVKAQSSHVLAMGVGAAVTDGNSARRLTAISGFDECPVRRELRGGRLHPCEEFDDLAAALRQIAIDLCRASVTVTKVVDERPPRNTSPQRLDFTADVEARRLHPGCCRTTPGDRPGRRRRTMRAWPRSSGNPPTPTATSTVTMIDR